MKNFIKLFCLIFVFTIPFLSNGQTITNIIKRKAAVAFAPDVLTAKQLARDSADWIISNHVFFDDNTSMITIISTLGEIDLYWNGDTEKLLLFYEEKYCGELIETINADTQFILTFECPTRFYVIYLEK